MPTQRPLKPRRGPPARGAHASGDTSWQVCTQEVGVAGGILMGAHKSRALRCGFPGVRAKYGKASRTAVILCVNCAARWYPPVPYSYAAENGDLAGAKKAATEACSSPIPPTAMSAPTVTVMETTAVPLDVPKITTDLHDDIPSPPPPQEDSSQDARPKRLEYPDSHRGRDRLASIKDSNRKKLSRPNLVAPSGRKCVDLWTRNLPPSLLLHPA
ncbi:hypothetical protein K438DRAFT_1998545 [Mycena galopus ATCC 62051]|nr:hypothetical protein K438DRAFT_1998545 [Mycena galopus ATCC 62051]